MADIRPVSDLRNRFKEVETSIKASGGPIYFTQNGRPLFVLVSNEKYEQLAGEVSPRKTLTKENMKQFGSVISNIRLIRGMERDELAQKINVPASHIENIENGDIIPADEDVAALSLALGMDETTLRFFLGGNETPFANKFLAKILNIIANMKD